MANHPHDSKRPPSAAVRKAVESGDIEALKNALSTRMKRFAEEYIVDFNGTAAVIRAGYAKAYADRQAYALLHHIGVVAYIDHLTQSKVSKMVSINPDYVVAQVIAIIGKDGAKDGDRLRGLELLARHLGMFIDRTELTGKDGGPLELRETQDAADAFTSSIASLADRRGESEVDGGTKH